MADEDKEQAGRADSDAGKRKGLIPPGNIILPADTDAKVGLKLKIRQRGQGDGDPQAAAPPAVRPTSRAVAAETPPAPAPPSQPPSFSSAEEDETDRLVRKLLGDDLAPPPPVAPRQEEGSADDTASALIPTGGDGHVSYRFRNSAADDSADGEAESAASPAARVRAAQLETDDNRLAAVFSIVLFLSANLLLAFAMFGIGNPLERFTPATLAGILISQLVFTGLSLADKPVMRVLARTAAGTMTLLASLATVGFFAFEAFVAPSFSLAFFDPMPSASLIGSATFLFAASLLLLTRSAAPHWIIACICVLAACVTPAIPVHSLVARGQIAAREAPRETAAAVADFPPDWTLIARQPLGLKGERLTYRLRIAPLEATVQPVTKTQLFTSLELVGKQMKEDFQKRPGTSACMLSTVDGKPNQMRLLSIGERKTAVLIIATPGGIHTISVTGKADIFNRHESAVNTLFSTFD